MPESPRRIPAVVNAKSGTAEAARDAIRSDERFELREVPPEQLDAALKELTAKDTPRLLISGGDGTVGTAASAVVGTAHELAILPGGTLNHFAKDLGISTEPADALSLAATGSARGVDVAMANEKLFLNTSSVGAYVGFVRLREELEKHLPYRIASFIAAMRILFQFRRITVNVEVDGKMRTYHTPLVFIGVGERELQAPLLGNRVPNGKRGLHVLIVRGRTRARLVALALNAVARGVKSMAKTPELDSFIVERCTITTHKRGHVALDGELVMLGSPIEYELRRDAINVVCP